MQWQQSRQRLALLFQIRKGSGLSLFYTTVMGINIAYKSIINEHEIHTITQNLVPSPNYDLDLKLALNQLTSSKVPKKACKKVKYISLMFLIVTKRLVCERCRGHFKYDGRQGFEWFPWTPGGVEFLGLRLQVGFAAKHRKTWLNICALLRFWLLIGLYWIFLM